MHPIEDRLFDTTSSVKLGINLITKKGKKTTLGFGVLDDTKPFKCSSVYCFSIMMRLQVIHNTSEIILEEDILDGAIYF